MVIFLHTTLTNIISVGGQHMKLYVTLTGLNYYMGSESMRINDCFILKKDIYNPYDDEAIKVIKENDCAYGYVANSVYTVARGTHSAGYIYDKFDDSIECTVKFIFESCAIAEIEIA